MWNAVDPDPHPDVSKKMEIIPVRRNANSSVALYALYAVCRFHQTGREQACAFRLISESSERQRVCTRCAAHEE